MFYCYSFIYEDYVMMDVFNVIDLQVFGYEEVDIKFFDLMELEWRVKVYNDISIFLIQLDVFFCFVVIGVY